MHSAFILSVFLLFLSFVSSTVERSESGRVSPSRGVHEIAHDHRRLSGRRSPPRGEQVSNPIDMELLRKKLYELKNPRSPRSHPNSPSSPHSHHSSRSHSSVRSHASPRGSAGSRGSPKAGVPPWSDSEVVVDAIPNDSDMPLEKTPFYEGEEISRPVDAELLKKKLNAVYEKARAGAPAKKIITFFQSLYGNLNLPVTVPLRFSSPPRSPRVYFGSHNTQSTSPDRRKYLIGLSGS